MNRMVFFITSLFFLMPLMSYGQEIEPSADSIYSYIEKLSVDIGPRPMGSVNETRALEWVRDKFASFGADTSFIMPFCKAEARRGWINTHSGVAVAVFQGETDSAIVIGGHLDSAGPEFPGANDNASGSATVLELARSWSQRPLHYTMIFCAFGGEEKGLLGSKHFVNHYASLDRVVLMISADMAASEGNIITMFETDSVQAPRWLVRDAFAAARAEQVSRLVYPTHFSTTNMISKGGAGSDHMSFLEKGIPAIDFTTGINVSPIHTARDKIDFISPAQLDEYVRLIDHLLRSYQQNGVPVEWPDEPFMLWNPLGLNLFIPVPLIFAFDLLALLVGIIAFIYSRKTRLQIEKADRILYSGVKLFFMLVIMALFPQLGESFIQLIKGVRYPWFINIYKYLIYDLIWLGAGLWLVLQLTRKWKFSPDPYVYTKRALLVLIIFLVPALLLHARLSLYPALALFFLSLAIFIPMPLIRAMLTLAAPLFLFRLMITESFPFMMHMMANSGFMIDNFIKALLYGAVLALLLILFSLPLIYSYGFLVVTSPGIKNVLRKFRRPAGAVAVAVLIAGFGIYLLFLPAYNEMWKPAVHVTARYSPRDGKSSIKITGNEYFKDLQVRGDSLNANYSGRKHLIEVPHTFKSGWLHVGGAEKVYGARADTLDFDWKIISQRPWIQTTLELRADSADISYPQANYAFSHEKNRMRFVWQGDYPDTLVVSGKMGLAPGVKLIRRVIATYSGVPVNLTVQSGNADVRYRTVITWTDTLNAARDLVTIISGR